MVAQRGEALDDRRIIRRTLSFGGSVHDSATQFVPFSRLPLRAPAAAGGVLAVVRSPDLLHDLKSEIVCERLSHCDSVHLLRDGMRALPRAIIYETGVWGKPLGDELIGLLSLSGTAAPVFACWRSGARALDEVRAIIAHLPNPIVVHERVNLSSELRRRVTDSYSPRAERMLRRLTLRRIGQPVDDVLAAAMLLSSARVNVPILAHTLGISPTILRERCRAAGWPKPVSVLAWTRSIYVVAMLERGGESLSAIALRGGEGSARDCADYVRFHTGLAPTRWVDAGGTACISERFLEYLAQPRLPVGASRFAPSRLTHQAFQPASVVFP